MDKLIKLAQKAKRNSYSPYSNFRVGAAVEMTSGNIYTGTNVENSSYGLSICAERSAIFTAISAGESKIKNIVISCNGIESSENSLMPCGACRQVISEFSTENTTIHVEGIGSFKVQDLLPKPFSLDEH